MGDLVKDHYSDSLHEHGATARGMAWFGSYGQQARFAELLHLGDLGSGCLLDVGCGTGALCTFLEARFSTVDYTGLDHNQDMLAAARAAHPEARFLLGDVAVAPLEERFDWVVASGIFNLTELDETAQQRRVRRGLRHMFDSAERGVACNFLSPRQTAETPPPSRAGVRVHFEEPGALLQAALELTPYCSLRHATLDPTSFTLYLYHGLAPEARRIESSLPRPGRFADQAAELQSRLEAEGESKALAWIEGQPSGLARDYLRYRFLEACNRWQEALVAVQALQESIYGLRDERAALLAMFSRHAQIVCELEPYLHALRPASVAIFVASCLELQKLAAARRGLAALPTEHPRFAALSARLAEAP